MFTRPGRRFGVSFPTGKSFESSGIFPCVSRYADMLDLHGFISEISMNIVYGYLTWWIWYIWSSWFSYPDQHTIYTLYSYYIYIYSNIYIYIYIYPNIYIYCEYEISISRDIQWSIRVLQGELIPTWPGLREPGLSAHLARRVLPEAWHGHGHGRLDLLGLASGYVEIAIENGHL